MQRYEAAYADYWSALVIAGAFTVARIAETRFVLRPFATKVIGLKPTDRGVAKFCEAAWKLQVWIPLFVLGLLNAIHEPWFFNSKELFSKWPNPMTWWMRAYYLIELGWYGHAQIALMFFENETGKNRSDYWAMTVHHFSTIMLVSFSYLNGYSPVGCMIMGVHDIVDIPLEAALLFKEIPGTLAQLLTDVFFAVFALFWFIFRLYVFPYFLVYQGVFRDMVDTCPKKPGHPNIGVVRYLHQFYFAADQDEQDPSLCRFTRFLSTFTIILCVLHLWWGWLILKMCKRFIFDKHVVGDIRDDEIDGRNAVAGLNAPEETATRTRAQTRTKKHQE